MLHTHRILKDKEKSSPSHAGSPISRDLSLKWSCSRMPARVDAKQTCSREGGTEGKVGNMAKSLSRSAFEQVKRAHRTEPRQSRVLCCYIACPRAPLRLKSLVPPDQFYLIKSDHPLAKRHHIASVFLKENLKQSQVCQTAPESLSADRNV